MQQVIIPFNLTKDATDKKDKKKDKKDKEKKDGKLSKHAAAVIGIALIAMGEDIGR